MLKPITPEPAATVVLIRETDSGLEVFLTRRQDRLKFLGGYHVFPGGKLDKRDGSKDTRERCGDFPVRLNNFVLPGDHEPEESISYYVAAIRELFEEAGILLAYRGNEKLVGGDDKDLWQNLCKAREKIHGRGICMTDMMKDEGLTYALDQLVWLSRWVTPATSPRRFDTQFFLARIPDGQKPVPFGEEISDSGWISPEDAINKWRHGEIKIIPPTLASLDSLVKYETWPEINNDLCNKKREGREFLF